MRFSSFNLEYFNSVLKERNLFEALTAISFSKDLVLLQDAVYGQYLVSVYSFCPKSKIPLHRERRRLIRMEEERKKYVGKDIKGLKVLDVFYGPDRGYKNKSFFFEYVSTCGHVSINTKAVITKHKSQFMCRSCAAMDHGDRGKIDGILKKRTPTYTHWQRIKNTLPAKYMDYYVFKSTAGDKPYKKANIELVDNTPVWIDLQVCDEHETNLIASALRQAFRHSKIYKDAVRLSSVQTDKGTRYLCSNCKQLAMRRDIQVDHIDPVMPLDGSPLLRSELLTRIWTNNIAILDKKCHALKSRDENALRRENKKKGKIK